MEDVLEAMRDAIASWCEENNSCFPLYYEQEKLREQRLEAGEDAVETLPVVAEQIARAALRAAAEKGWVLVPREATEEMARSVLWDEDAPQTMVSLLPGQAKRAWELMLSAAPSLIDPEADT